MVFTDDSLEKSMLCTTLPHNVCLVSAGGYNYLAMRQRRLTSTSSDGPDYRHINHVSLLPTSCYRLDLVYYNFTMYN